LSLILMKNIIITKQLIKEIKDNSSMMTIFREQEFPYMKTSILEEKLVEKKNMSSFRSLKHVFIELSTKP
jgi:hypothetical protein